MKVLLTLAWLLVFSAPAVLGGILELKQMIEEVTGKDAFLDYGFYGCYCGLGGQGTPKDATDRLEPGHVTKCTCKGGREMKSHQEFRKTKHIHELRANVCRTDRCCWEHDRCYDVLQKKGSNTWMQYYKYRYSRGVVTCEPGPRLQVQLCDCDRKLVYCLKKNLNSYNPKYKHVTLFCCN